MTAIPRLRVRCARAPLGMTALGPLSPAASRSYQEIPDQDRVKARRWGLCYGPTLKQDPAGARFPGSLSVQRRRSMRRIRPFTAWLTILMLLQTVLVGSRGFCDALAEARSGDRLGHGQHAAAMAAKGHPTSHEQRLAGTAGMITATDVTCSGPHSGCGDDAMPNGRACDATACVPAAVLPALVVTLRAPAAATSVWTATPRLHSTLTAPDTPPPRA
jgi:hypothetical protein